MVLHGLYIAADWSKWKWQCTTRICNCCKCGAGHAQPLSETFHGRWEQIYSDCADSHLKRVQKVFFFDQYNEKSPRGIFSLTNITSQILKGFIISGILGLNHSFEIYPSACCCQVSNMSNLTWLQLANLKFASWSHVKFTEFSSISKYVKTD